LSTPPFLGVMCLTSTITLDGAAFMLTDFIRHEQGQLFIMSCANKNVPSLAPVKMSPWTGICGGTQGDTLGGPAGAPEGAQRPEAGPPALPTRQQERGQPRSLPLWSNRPLCAACWRSPLRRRHHGHPGITEPAFAIGTWAMPCWRRGQKATEPGTVSCLCHNSVWTLFLAERS